MVVAALELPNFHSTSLFDIFWAHAPFTNPQLRKASCFAPFCQPSRIDADRIAASLVSGRNQLSEGVQVWRQKNDVRDSR